MRSSQAARGGRAVTVGLKSSGNTKGRRRTLGGGRLIKIQCRRRVCKVYQVKRQRVSWAMGECWMVTVNAGKRTEDDSVESGEWRGEYQGGAERKSALAYRVERISLEDCQTNVFVEVLRVRW
jgi:hypothetical protein